MFPCQNTMEVCQVVHHPRDDSITVVGSSGKRREPVQMHHISVKWDLATQASDAETLGQGMLHIDSNNKSQQASVTQIAINGRIMVMGSDDGGISVSDGGRDMWWSPISFGDSERQSDGGGGDGEATELGADAADAAADAAAGGAKGSSSRVPASPTGSDAGKQGGRAEDSRVQGLAICGGKILVVCAGCVSMLSLGAFGDSPAFCDVETMLELAQTSLVNMDQVLLKAVRAQPRSVNMFNAQLALPSNAFKAHHGGRLSPTLLHYAVQANDEDLFNAIVNCGECVVLHRNGDDQTALDLANTRGNRWAVEGIFGAVARGVIQDSLSLYVTVSLLPLLLVRPRTTAHATLLLLVLLRAACYFHYYYLHYYYYY